MPSLSPLQTLPLHAVDLIVDHIADNTRIADDNTYRAVANINNKFFKNHLILLMPLLWVCRNFRAAVYSRFFKYYGLRFDKGTDKAIGRPYGVPRCLEGLDGHFRITAKELTIFIDLLAVYSGKALVALSHEPFSGCSFPLVRTLEISLFNSPGDTDATDVPLDVEANISAFVQRIQQMAPKLNMVRMRDTSSLGQQTTATTLHFGNLATQLIQFVNRVKLTSGLGNVFQSLQINVIRHLTHLHACVDLDSDVVAYVSSNYSPMGAKFRCWHIENNRVEYSEGEVVPFLLLALVCPNFNHILVIFYMREILAKQLEKAIHKTTPRKHAARWRRLVFHIQNYC
ncbi:hypothetical protein GGI16_000162 [Coemansia sp. S142-1]|nr:hypothetical protein GGI16_000162 [Coemansia sp. S142-1]